MYISRSELVDIIVRNNMVKEFALWVKKIKGDDGDPISLRDVDYELLLRFVVEKKLIDVEDLPDYLKEAEVPGFEIDEEFRDLEKQAIPKKIRRKT